MCLFFIGTLPLCSDGSLPGLLALKVPVQHADAAHLTILFRLFFKTATAQSLSSRLWVFLQDTGELNLISAEQERTW